MPGKKIGIAMLPAKGKGKGAAALTSLVTSTGRKYLAWANRNFVTLPLCG
jgi:hypothetical protein